MFWLYDTVTYHVLFCYTTARGLNSPNWAILLQGPPATDDDPLNKVPG